MKTEPTQAITLDGTLIPAYKQPAKGMMDERQCSGVDRTEKEIVNTAEREVNQ